MNNPNAFYTVEQISGAMSLRTPQRDSLAILADLYAQLNPQKGDNLEEQLHSVNRAYPTCTSFERDFMSLTFALATGVGKTRLMGAFITYLYTNYGIKNFFIVAPGTTVYEKLKSDLGDPSHPKYVFKGLGCFAATRPMLITDDDYRSRQLRLDEADVKLFIFNIDKFNKTETAKMHQMNEYIGKSFFAELSDLKDLVLIMDESHHYRAQAGLNALNELRPVLGLELTATPLVKKGSRQVPFKNVVYEYPLSAAIRDGYTRTPFALTRTNINVKSLGELETDQMMLNDALLFHQSIRAELEAYATNNKARLVKPFMLVVCKDTDHAERVQDYIRSEQFAGGAYSGKTIMVHSNLKGAESEANLKQLLEVESAENPIEIVIHVNMLKEGWDVNNLYTIVPLRTAASQILREQMVGRGLRLPFGKRTGSGKLDIVALAAHDNFNELLEKAQAADSIFKAGNVIKAESLEQTYSTQVQVELPLEPMAMQEGFYKATGAKRTSELDYLLVEVDKLTVEESVASYGTNKRGQSPEEDIAKQAQTISQNVKDKIAKVNPALAEIYANYVTPLEKILQERAVECMTQIKKKFIPIPQIKISDEGIKAYKFADFELDLTRFNQRPVENKLLMQNLANTAESQMIEDYKYVTLDNSEPIKDLAREMIKFSSIDYEACGKLLAKLLGQLMAYYVNNYGEDGFSNIVKMFKPQICQEVLHQMLEHRTIERGFVTEEVCGLSESNLASNYNWSKEQSLYSTYDGNIGDILFNDIKKGVFPQAKFDSRPELRFAQILEREESVKNWLRPAPSEFELTYGEGKKYEPDFVVETADTLYLIEVKGEDRLDDVDVQAKKERSVSFCNLASEWATANHCKPWKHVFIPSQEIKADTTFVGNLAERFEVKFAPRS